MMSTPLLSPPTLPVRSPVESSTRLVLTLGPGLSSAPYGDLVIFDWEERAVVDRYRFRHQVHAASHKGLAGASWSGERLIVTTEAEVLEFETAPLRLVSVRSFPFFNDVHHVVRTADRHWVCNTGLDAIEEFDRDWKWLKSHELVRPFGRSFSHLCELFSHDMLKSWRRWTGRYKQYGHLGHRPAFRNLSKVVAYESFRRRYPELRHSDLRPHVLHPNHLLPVGDDLWVTLWRTGQIVSLKQQTVLASGLGHPHDGVFFDDEYYVTDCQSNRLLVFHGNRERGRLGDLKAERVITRSLWEGFLRGVYASGPFVYVGLTARRGARPIDQTARIVKLDRQTLDTLDTWTVPAEYGTGVFSILAAGE